MMWVKIDLLFAFQVRPLLLLDIMYSHLTSPCLLSVCIIVPCVLHTSSQYTAERFMLLMSMRCSDCELDHYSLCRVFSIEIPLIEYCCSVDRNRVSISSVETA